MRELLISSIFILLSMQGCIAHNRIYSVPFTPRIDPWIRPSEGVLISENTPVYIAHKQGNDVHFQKHDNIIKPAMDYAMQLPEYQIANVDSFIRHIKPSIIQSNDQNPHTNTTVLYPELMIVIAHDLYQELRKDVWTVIPYIVAFYSGVDIVFRELENPKIRLNIAAIVIENEYGVLEYLKNSSVDPTKLKGAHLREAVTFWYKQKDTLPLDSYDAIMSMTKRNLCMGHGNKPETCPENVRGVALPGKICQYSDTYKEVPKIMAVVDNGNFLGVYATAHEIGHSLGASHDYTFMKSEQGNYDDIPRCNGSHYKNIMGYIMFPSVILSTGQRFWSDCSLDYFQRFLREGNHTCLHNVPASGQYSVPRFMPGKIMKNMHNLCKLFGYGKPCKGFDPCERIVCELNDTDSRCVLAPSNVMDGISCDNNDSTKFCMVGKCVTSNEFK